MTFFYDLNKRLATLASKQDAEQITESVKAQAPRSKLAESMGVAEADYSAKKAAAGKDIGKPGKNFAKIAKSAGAKYGSKAAGERVAGAVLNKLRAKNESAGIDPNRNPQTQDYSQGGDVMDYLNDKLKDFDAQQSKTDESAFQAAIGKKKYGEKGMKALQKAGREGASDKTMKNIRNRYDKYDESQGMTDEGNAFTAALKATPKGGKFKVGGKEFTDTSDLEEGFKEMDAYMASREKEKGTGKFDKRITSTGTVYTRKPETFDDPETDPEATGGAPKRRGRPKGKDKGPERVTAKSYKYKTGRPTKTQEDLDSDGVLMTRSSNMSSEAIEPGDRGEYDQEGESAKHDIKTIVRHAQALHKILGDDDNLPEWVQSKLAKIEGMMIAVDEYMQNQDQEVSEAGKPDFLDLDKDGNKKEPMKKAARDKKEKTVDETTVAGSVATAPVAAKKSSGGFNFGGSVYEGLNAKVENMITEGMSINISVDEQGKKSISVNATEQDAEALADLLKMAGLGGAGREESCATCNQAPCGCAEVVDENSPDYPTNTETSDNALQYSGGLNGPKSTGQTTVPVVASQLQRQASMEESVALERNLFKTWKNYKG